MTPPPPSFLAKKRRILAQLALPASQYDDLSPKGSVDEGIRDLITEINELEGCVTTSSCAGRVSVFLEGSKTPSKEIDGNGEGEQDDGGRETKAGTGGKGGGGRWLFVSHDPVHVDEGVPNLAEFLGMERRDEDVEGRGMRRLVHFKFEPMVPNPSPPPYSMHAILMSNLDSTYPHSIPHTSTNPPLRGPPSRLPRKRSPEFNRGSNAYGGYSEYGTGS
jgi:tRNA(Phe) wybutosine-synthesizing methylase Tyw3